MSDSQHVFDKMHFTSSRRHANHFLERFSDRPKLAAWFLAHGQTGMSIVNFLNASSEDFDPDVRFPDDAQSASAHGSKPASTGLSGAPPATATDPWAKTVAKFRAAAPAASSPFPPTDHNQEKP